MKAILAHPAYTVRLDKAGLAEYFTFQNFLGDRTLFADIRLLPPGHTVCVAAGAPAHDAPRRYWDFHFAEADCPVAEQEYAEELDRLFRQAVNRQLVADVPIGAYLSGGMDSGSITALAAARLSGLQTFTCGFDLNSAAGPELRFDERQAAARLSACLGTEHHAMVLQAGDMERALPRLAWALEEPRVGQSYPNYYIAQLARTLVTVVLSGAGGDELFGGYPWRYYQAVVNDSFDHYLDKYYRYWRRLIPDAAFGRVFAPIWADVRQVDTRALFRDVFPADACTRTRPEDYINHSLYFDLKTFLHGLLVVEDKLSMAHGLETRVPFLDNDLVDFALRVPARMKLGNLGNVVRLNQREPGAETAAYFDNARDGKLILRSVMARYIPAEVTARAKQGFSAPDASWFRQESRGYVRELLYDPHARLYDYLDRAAVQALVDEHLDGAHNRRLLIWSLLSIELWLRQYLL